MDLSLLVLSLWFSAIKKGQERNGIADALGLTRKTDIVVVFIDRGDYYGSMKKDTIGGIIDPTKHLDRLCSSDSCSDGINGYPITKFFWKPNSMNGLCIIAIAGKLQTGCLAKTLHTNP